MMQAEQTEDMTEMTQENTAAGTAERTVEAWLGEDNQLGIEIWKKKYCFQGESFERWLTRVSGGDEALKELIWEKKFLFGGRTLSNRGTGRKATLSNCYSLGYAGDSLEELMRAATEIAETFKSQGGQGLSLSQVRPKGTPIGSNGFKSDGIIPFMEIFNQVTASISQGGSRKGALIMTLDAWHKEAPDFITVKSETDRITKANLSVEIDDEFMDCVRKYYETGEEITKTITRTYAGHEISYEVTPIRLYKLMIAKAWDWGEPGCIFTNRFRNYNIMEKCDDYQIITCNPCGEQPLPKGGCCNLGSLNLSPFVSDPFTEKAAFDHEGFCKAVEISIRAMDKIVSENMDNHALPLQREMAGNYRNIGLGIMGLYDAFAKMGMAYDSKEARDMADVIMREMFRTAVETSSQMAAEMGSFPNYSEHVWESEIIRKHFSDEEIAQLKKKGLRNCSLLSIAPAGSIGTMLNCSTGAEPAFSISYKRRTVSLNGDQDREYEVFTGVAAEYRKMFPDAPIPSYFKTSGNIAWKDRVDLQGILQEHVDTGISSTVNLANEITADEIEQLYLYAWEKGCKGITIFRDGCKRLGILTKEPEKKAESKATVNGTEDMSNGTAADGTAAAESAADTAVRTAAEADNTGRKLSGTAENAGDAAAVRAAEAGTEDGKYYIDTPVSTLAAAKRSTVSEVTDLPRGFILAPDDSCIGLKRTITSGCGTLHVEAFFDPENGDLYETYFSKGSTGGCNSFMSGLSRMVSLAARGGVPFEAILDQLHSALTCPSYSARHAVRGDTSRGNCCPSAIAYALEDMHRQMIRILDLDTEERVPAKKTAATGSDGIAKDAAAGSGLAERGAADSSGSANVAAQHSAAKSPHRHVATISAYDLKNDSADQITCCPDCGSTKLEFIGGCVSCPDCGWTRCD